jgi:hypothetical protein
MRPVLASIATRVSRFRYVLAIAAIVSCTHRMASDPEPDLTGPFPCGNLTCGTGQICSDLELDGSDGSAHPIDEYSCATPPADCRLAACNTGCEESSGSDCCPECIVDLCGSYVIGYDGERSIACYGF